MSFAGDKVSPLTRQEMFDRAVRGLRSQGWRPARVPDTNLCLYKTEVDGVLCRCAWGWVDPEATANPNVEGTLWDLNTDGVGLAAELNIDDLEWARRLQQAHDASQNSSELQRSMHIFGTESHLTWPED